MNYYQRHIGDYAAATRHLSILEHGVYTLLLDRYYVDECALPADPIEAARLIGARSKPEIAAVKSVLKDFFTLVEGGGWQQTRCEEEIAAYQTFIQQQKDRANKRWKVNGNATAYADGMPPHMPPHANGIDPAMPPTPTPTPTPNLNPKSGKAAIPDSPPDPRKQIFELGKTILGENAGALISKAIGQSSEPTVGAILGEMSLQTYADPRAYFMAAIKSKSASGRFKTA